MKRIYPDGPRANQSLNQIRIDPPDPLNPRLISTLGSVAMSPLTAARHARQTAPIFFHCWPSFAHDKKGVGSASPSCQEEICRSQPLTAAIYRLLFAVNDRREVRAPLSFAYPLRPANGDKTRPHRIRDRAGPARCRIKGSRYLHVEYTKCR